MTQISSKSRQAWHAKCISCDPAMAIEPCMQSAAFKIERQLPHMHVTTQKHMHITYADTHTCVSLGLYRFITSYANFFQYDFTVYISNSKLQDTFAADVAPSVAARSANNPSQQQIFHEI